VTYYRPPASGR